MNSEGKEQSKVYEGILWCWNDNNSIYSHIDLISLSGEILIKHNIALTYSMVSPKICMLISMVTNMT